MDFFIVVSRLLFEEMSGSESGCLGLESQAFGMRGVAKNHRSWTSHVSGLHLMIWGGLCTNFHDLVALEAGLKFNDFSR